VAEKNHKYMTREIESLIPYAKNPRTHSDHQVSQVVASIKEFGFTNPILIDPDGGIIAGHGRVMAAKHLGLTQIPCIELNGLTAEQRKAYIMADNQLALNSGWDLDLVSSEFLNLQSLGFDTDLIGFDDEFINGLLDGQKPKDHDVDEFDEVDEFDLDHKCPKCGYEYNE
jgi:ParB family transcriptional regulator, chromosome partitioning protein